MAAKVFISYSHQDSETAKGISRFLLKQEYNVWIDFEKLVSGQNWAANIDEALSECDFFIALISQNSVRRREVIREISEALRKKAHDISKVIFVVIGHVHPSWFAGQNSEDSKVVIQHLEKIQHIHLDAKGTISIQSMHNILKALNGEVFISEEDYIKSGNYIYESGMPERTYDNESGNFLYRVNTSDLSASAAFPFALDNQWVPDEVLSADSRYRSLFLNNGFSSDEVKKCIDAFQLKNLFLSLMHNRQIILNRASFLNSPCLYKYYVDDSEYLPADKEAFDSLLSNGSLIVFLYGDNEITPYVSEYPLYDINKQTVESWNRLCSRIAMYCIRENWEIPIDKHSEEFVKHCTTFAVNREENEMISECLGFNASEKEEFLTVLKEIEMTVFLKSHITGTGNRSVVKGYSRSSFYKDFVVAQKSEKGISTTLNCIFDTAKPFHEPLKKIIDIFYNSIFVRYFECNPLIPNIKPEDTYIHQLYLPHGGKEVSPDELEYAFSDFLSNEKILDRIADIGEKFYIDSWTLSEIAEYRKSIKWLEYIELLEYVTNRINTWQVDFNEIEKLVDIFVDSIEDSEKPKEKSMYIPAYTFRLCIGSKVLDIVVTKNVRKLKEYRGVFAEKKQNPLTLQFIIGDTTLNRNNVKDSIFLPIMIFDGKTNHIGGNTYYEEIRSFLVEQCDFIWVY